MAEVYKTTMLNDPQWESNPQAHRVLPTFEDHICCLLLRSKVTATQRRSADVTHIPTAKPTWPWIRTKSRDYLNL